MPRALFAMLANDEQHGEQNRKTMQGWLQRVGAARASPPAAAMQPIWSQPGEKVIRFEESAGARPACASMNVLADLNLNAKELD